MSSPESKGFKQLTIDRSLPEAIYIQIADRIISAIKDGSLRPGTALPSTRQLGAALKVNRNTVVRAFEILSAEGWISTTERHGTVVSETLPLAVGSKRNRPLIADSEEIFRGGQIFIDDGIPDITRSPINELARAYRRVFKQKARWQIMNLSNKLGDLHFREALSGMLNRNRQMRTSAGQLCITRGSQMALFLTAHCLLKKDDVILVENPGFKPAWEAFRHAGARIIPIKVEPDGICVEDIEQFAGRDSVKAVYLTPHHQYPTTVTLSLSKRLRLIELSNHYGFTIIEDDYDNEFHFGLRPVMPIAAYEEVQNYVYIGTFSKLIAPAIRIGYIYSSLDFIERVGELRRIMDMQGDNFMEQALLDLIDSGELRRHQKRMAEVYRKKRDFFASMLETHLHEKVKYNIPTGGLAFWLVPTNDKIDLYKVREQTNKSFVHFYTPDRFSFSEPVCGIRLGYASLSDEDLEKGLSILGKYL